MSNERQVVSDTGPLITLEKLPDGFRFIRLLYDEILIPSAVLQEVVQGQFGEAEAYLAHYGIQDLIRVVEIDSQQEMAGLDILDQGEQEAIRLALKENLLLLIEEEAGRAVAQQLGIRISGIAGQVLRAFRNDQIGADEAVQKLRVLYETGRINRRLYEGLTDTVQRAS